MCSSVRPGRWRRVRRCSLRCPAPSSPTRGSEMSRTVITSPGRWSLPRTGRRRGYRGRPAQLPRSISIARDSDVTVGTWRLTNNTVRPFLATSLISTVTSTGIRRLRPPVLRRWQYLSFQVHRCGKREPDIYIYIYTRRIALDGNFEEPPQQRIRRYRGSDDGSRLVSCRAARH
jgi:hypothetical protein